MGVASGCGCKEVFFFGAPSHIYIADMRTKEVSKCTVTSERSVFF